MVWKSISPEDVKKLKFVKNAKENQWAGALEAALKGPVQVDIPEGSNLQSLKWSLSRAIKKAGDTVLIQTLADKTGVVLVKREEPATTK